MPECIPLKNRYMAVNARKIITIVGAESSGKSTLARQMAAYFGCTWVPEYAREYLGNLNRPYDAHDLEVIAGRQMEIIEKEKGRFDSLDGHFGSAQRPEDSSDRFESRDIRFGSAQRPEDSSDRFESRDGRFGSAQRLEFPEIIFELTDLIKSKFQNQNSEILIIDGGMLNIRMWAMIKFGITIPVVEEALRNDHTDLYILCRPLDTWSEDPLREAPELLERSWIYNQYLHELHKNKMPYIIGA